MRSSQHFLREIWQRKWRNTVMTAMCQKWAFYRTIMMRNAIWDTTKEFV